jgi:hypothetical protein
MNVNRGGKVRFRSDVEITIESQARFKSLTNDVHCRARQGEFRCVLDNIHREFGTAHLHRNEDGSLAPWRKTEGAIDESTNIT